ncbi:hypothetical protein [Pseudactinotalea sp.]|uniref:hypothetical protein n=1 Tax=Pseudactinotalea sp. TaxID=1926260 RepID=UPI003B3A61A1
MAFNPLQPFTRAAADAAGLTWRRLSGPRYQRLFQGVYVSADVPVTPLVRARGALLAVGGDAAIYGVSAAEVRELPVPVSEDVHVLVDPDARRVRVSGIVIHRGRRKLSEYRGIPLTMMADTFVDVGRDHPLVDAVALGDAMVLRGFATPQHLVRTAAAETGRGIRRARRAASLVRSRVDSPRETRLRLLMVFNGLPEPEIAYEVTAAGRMRRLDTAYPEWRVATEYDGRHHVERDQQWSDDLERREELNHEQWRVVTVTGRQAWDPERVLARIRRALADAGAPLPPPRQEWRRHFPVARSFAADGDPAMP